MMAGGCGESQSADAEIQALVDSVKPFVESSKSVSYTKFEAVSFRAQVVAGTNYFVKVLVHASDSVESTLLLRIFKPLPFAGTDAQLAGVKDVEKDSEISFF
eukprot:CAMPEP_0172151442 /NCGR_PEP_ID=MMETSP1050-20130122/231_1 /TAXON_ID=233186 /ORGANISM="Cryptomonas curvata, Strain CCAP979/52" /LENGTH=101 /DNA_ID=CAMNT_0012819547 /DNA_START=9 /DNA_END=314 /DNA_ORIENTATION=-